MRWLRVGEKAWRDFWALLQVIHYSRYALFSFFYRRGRLFPYIDWIWWSGTYLYISDWKQSALCFLTRPCLGQSAMGLSAILLARWRNTRYLYFYYSSFMRCGEVGERAAFFLSKLHLIESWDDQLWYGMLYLFSNRLILFVLSLLLFFFPHIVHFTLLSQFLSTCIRYFCCYQLGTIRDYVNQIAFIWTWSRRLSISQAEAKRVYPGQMVDEDFEKGWVLLSAFFFFFETAVPVPLSRRKSFS